MDFSDIDAHTIVIEHNASDGQSITQTSGNSGFYVGTNEVFHQGNDGSGSGLDADSLDGIGSGGFLRSNVSDTAAAAITFSGGAGAISLAADSDIRFTNSSSWTGPHAGKIQ